MKTKLTTTSEARTTAKCLFAEAMEAESFVATVSVRVDGKVKHKTVRVNFPAQDLKDVLDHLRSIFLKMGMSE